MQIDTKWVILGGVFLLIVFAIVYFSWPTPRPLVDTTRIINEAKVEMEKQFRMQIEAKDDELKALKSRLFVSESKYKLVVKKLEDLKKEKINVKLPETEKEMRDRFTALGFPPLPRK